MHKFLCCLLSGLLAVAAVCLPIGSSVAAEQQISRTGITIPEDTVLQLELMNFLESKRNKVGDTVSVKLLEAVSVADEVIIPKGTVLEGYLKKVQKGKLLSQKGVIRMRLKDYYLPNGYLLRLNNEEIKFSGDMNLLRWRQVWLFLLQVWLLKAKMSAVNRGCSLSTNWRMMWR